MMYHSWTRCCPDHCIFACCDTNMFSFSFVEGNDQVTCINLPACTKNSDGIFSLNGSCIVSFSQDHTAHARQSAMSVSLGGDCGEVKQNLFSSGIGQWTSPLVCLACPSCIWEEMHPRLWNMATRDNAVCKVWIIHSEEYKTPDYRVSSISELLIVTSGLRQCLWHYRLNFSRVIEIIIAPKPSTMPLETLKKYCRKISEVEKPALSAWLA